MSSFFTTPASQKKRKRSENTSKPSTKRRSIAPTPTSAARSSSTKRRKDRDESISGSEASEDEAVPQASSPSASESESDHENAAERRLRLAEQYLSNIRSEVDASRDEVGFDAAEIDRDLIAERLKEDVASTKGKLHKWIAHSIDWSRARRGKVNWGGHSSTGVTAARSANGQTNYLYTVDKGNHVVKWEVPKPTIHGQAARTIFDEEGQPKRPPIDDEKIQSFPNGNVPLNGHVKPPSPSIKPTKLAHFSCRRPPTSYTPTPAIKLHTGKILCVVASPSGRYLATGGTDKLIVIWDVSSPTSLHPIKSFSDHRSSVLSLSFRVSLNPSQSSSKPRGAITGSANQLFSAAADRTIKLFDLDALAYVETLFGHQDEVVDVAGCAGEMCVSVGSRDRTARWWKVVEESQLVFRGGGVAKKSKSKRRREGVEEEGWEGVQEEGFAEGSIDRVALVDEETFVTGSDNGSIALWNIHKKKPVFVVPLAHGLDPPMKREEALAEEPLCQSDGHSNGNGQVQDDWKPPPQQSRWITALTTVPCSDVVLSGSWEGVVRAWRIADDKRSIEAIGIVGRNVTEIKSVDGDGVQAVSEGVNENTQGVRGIVNDLTVFERGERGKEGLYIAAAVAKEHRLGRWKKGDGSNGAVVFEVSFKEKGPEPVDGIAEMNS
ncbi:MAG: pre-rRNA processing protein [Bogoriella megaspora]|nr:MAG: pre-rRNA processing protein [Bogoriella megaspora]